MTDSLLYQVLDIYIARVTGSMAWLATVVLAGMGIAAILYHRRITKKLIRNQVALQSKLTEQEIRLHALTEKEKLAVEEIFHARQSMKTLLNTLSHEIRTPMNGVLGMATLLSDTPLNNEQQQYLQSIRSCSELLMESINQILSLHATAFSDPKFSSTEESPSEQTSHQPDTGLLRLQATFSAQYPLRILVAEDNAMNQQFISMILKRLGYQADIAQHGKEVMELLKEKNYDLIFMDVQMPEMDGLDTTRKIRHEKTVQPVIIAMTANAMPGDREGCLRAGMDDYISKPLHIETLVVMMEKWAFQIHQRPKI